MEITLSQAAELVGQLQSAHRLAVGFYQRMLPQLSKIADDLGLIFWSWRPIYNDRPSQASKFPGEKWAWDLVPMYAVRFDFCTELGEHANVGDVAAVFKILLDDNYRRSQRKELGIKGEPDPVTMPVGNAIVVIDLFSCTANSQRSFEALWEDAAWPSNDNDGWEYVGEQISARKLTFSLAQFAAEPETIVASVRAALNAAPRDA